MWSEIGFHQNLDASGQLIHLFLYLFNKDLLNTYYVPGDTAEPSIGMSLLSCTLRFWCFGGGAWDGKQGNEQVNMTLSAGREHEDNQAAHAIEGGLAGQGGGEVEWSRQGTTAKSLSSKLEFFHSEAPHGPLDSQTPRRLHRKESGSPFALKLPLTSCVTLARSLAHLGDPSVFLSVHGRHLMFSN